MTADVTFTAICEDIARDMHKHDRPDQEWVDLSLDARSRYRDHAEVAVASIRERIHHIGAVVAALDHFSANGDLCLDDTRAQQMHHALQGAWFYVTHGEYMYLNDAAIGPLLDADQRRQQNGDSQ